MLSRRLLLISRRASGELPEIFCASAAASAAKP